MCCHHPSLIESELFGHESGAFTGASATGKKGLFETAHNGTLFLDEIGEIPLPIQVKFLKFLETMELIRVGGTRSVKINTRVIVATNRNLEQMVADGTFRQDLYFRLNVVPITIPSLAERPEDIVPLARSFLARFNKEFKTQKQFSKTVCQVFSQYPFPGNVRELENLVRRLVTMTENDFIDLGDLPPLPKGVDMASIEAEPLREPAYQKEVAAFEYTKLKAAVEEYGSQRKAAKALGISQSTLSRKLKKMK